MMSTTVNGKSLFLENPQLTPIDFEKAISSSPLFSVLAPTERQLLLKKSSKRTYKMAESICDEGEFGHSLYILVSGSVELGVFENQGGMRSHVWHVDQALSSKGESFGEESLIGRGQRLYSAVSTSSLTAIMEVDLPLFSRLDRLSNGKLTEELSSIQKDVLVTGLLNDHLVLRGVSDRGEKVLVKLSELKRLVIDDVMRYREGDLLILLSGLIEVQARDADRVERSLVYLNDHDFFKSDHYERELTLVARETSSYIILPQNGWRQLMDTDRTLLNNIIITPPVFQDAIAGSNTVGNFVGNLIKEGAQQGLSLLYIDLDQCVRCGQCTRACEARHGHARMTRHGQTVQRRRDIKVEGDYQSILLPSSCRHCVSPECMIGCPTSAIHRGIDGEVDIEDSCIGCGSCANRCPYGNITMIPTPERQVKDKIFDLKASKCNLCSGYDQPNCVNNCPTGAIARIQPQQYFEEFSHVISSPDQLVAGGGKKTEVRESEVKRKRRRISLLLSSITLLISGVGYMLSTMAPESPWSIIRLIFGSLTLFFMILTGMIAARRRRAGSRLQFGKLHLWTKAHTHFGILALVFMVYHTNGSPGRGLTMGVWYLAWAEVWLGVFGWLLYRWLPRVLTSLEAGVQVEEDAISALAEVDGLLMLHETEVQAARRAGGAPPSIFKVTIRPKAAQRWRDRVSRLPQDILGGKAISWSEQVLKRSQLRAYVRLHHLRRAWLIAHLGVSVALFLIIVVHIAVVLPALFN